MANVFNVEWTEKKQRVQSKVEMGNFDGTVKDVQKWLDQNWPVAYGGERTDIKVLNVFGEGRIVKVDVPKDK